MALQAALKQIEHQFGKGSIMRLGDAAFADVDVIPSGSLTVDRALGGGFPRGRIIEIYGPEASGKTTLALSVVGQAQKLGLTCAFIDAEHALDRSYAEAIGVDVDELWISQPSAGEEALEVADVLVRSNAVGLVVVDSVAALVPKGELEGDMGDAHIALQARLMSKALRKLTASLGNTNTMLIFINQLRANVGVMFGAKEVTSGGNALKYAASVRVDIRRATQLKDGDGSATGYLTRAKVTKNKVAPPFRTAEFDLRFGTGIDRMGELIDLGVQMGVVQKAGAWYSWDGQQLGQGREKTRAFLLDNEDTLATLEKQVVQALRDERAAARGGAAADTATDDSDDGDELV